MTKRVVVKSLAIALIVLCVAFTSTKAIGASDAPALICSNRATAFVGATVIDGRGGQPIDDSILIICKSRIAAIGKRSRIIIPVDAYVVEASGKYLIPGFIDANVHSVQDVPPELVNHQDVLVERGISFLQRHLEAGITTVRDTYGALGPTLRIRALIDGGQIVGPRLLVAGNIIGWGGYGSETFTGGNRKLTDLERQANELITQGVGEELADLDTDTLRVRIRQYLAKGVDFLKYGGTTHGYTPSLIEFSPGAQAAIIEEAHKRGKMVSTHCTTPEGIKMCVQAGVDIIQHAGSSTAPISPELASYIVDHHVVCSMQTLTKHFYEGYASRHPEFRSRFEQESVPPDPVNPNLHQDGTVNSSRIMSYHEPNIRLLIRSGCRIAVESDDQPLTKEVVLPWAIEELVNLGLTPLQAITAATQNGAIAAGGIADYGTLEVKKRADLILLEANPLADIHNITRQEIVMRDGQIVVRGGHILCRPPL